MLLEGTKMPGHVSLDKVGRGMCPSKCEEQQQVGKLRWKFQGKETVRTETPITNEAYVKREPQRIVQSKNLEPGSVLMSGGPQKTRQRHFPFFLDN